MSQPAFAALEPAGLALDPIATFELSPEGEPTSCLLRLRSIPETLPEGWLVQAERPGLVLVLPGAETVERSALEPLRRAVPSSARAGVPYVRVAPAELQLYLPLVAKD